ncbi:MAG: 1-(5-phosphoribosyl)-5-[(5-phosphoribosylamino)methylideneamino]imidazole-4-carboxamide isomerase [Buchnera aphidicola (Pentalonia nigronervosa)]|jgi:phosphoribosylformimino-5-aminoimidazole carboxamide ribotide isomerase|uniref:1-(5-phosphoribosyl)-5-[(5-phosphoribosylamino)methylideneamino] imidazole-4-carboxamide isomerase n=1 Tax=Buchnera aphidicola (Pentalonia nigronervosa) TaxID=1309793 RepID=A0A7H1AZE0_9GAMM|nr:MAG: 1-(5-phosphoribosyl)-5-[(5-phosphoribosylamino)methylideneamino]imidazole-4-carboxamide isomerase [Buchnera aphidicola (Pentalonia nigronervosa)]
MIIPAFDILDNNIVRLYQGNFSCKKHYDINLCNYLDDYQKQGVQFVHLVDLNGAKNTNNKQLEVFKKILSYSSIPIQIGGGIRHAKDIDIFLKMGIKRVVIGSSIIQNKEEVVKWLKVYGSDAIVFALDIKIDQNNNKKIFIHGWKKSTDLLLEDVIRYFLPFGLKHVLCTDISKDGTLSGPDVKLYHELVQYFKLIEFQASGGIGTLEDIKSLVRVGVQNIIIGRSLLERRFTIEEALQCYRNEL